MSQDIDTRIDIVMEEINTLFEKEEEFRLKRFKKEDELVRLYDIA